MSLLDPTIHVSEMVRRAQQLFDVPHESRYRTLLVILLADAGTRVEGIPGPTDSQSLKQQRERSQRVLSWRLLFSDDDLRVDVGFSTRFP